MNYKEFLYDKDKVLSFYPELAVIFNKYDDMEIERIKREEEEAERKGVILEKKEKRPDKNGLGKAIVVNQLNYWLNLNEKTHHNYKDGHYWLYFSYSNWIKEDFKFWSVKTLQRILTSLENCGVVISTSEYNRWKIDNTKWYRIDYERLQEIIDMVYERDCASGQLDQTVKTDCPDGQVNLTRPLPEITNIDYNTKIYKTKYAFPSEKCDAVTNKFSREYISKTINNIMVFQFGLGENSNQSKELTNIILYFLDQYEKKFRKKHPNISFISYVNIIKEYLHPFGENMAYIDDLETYQALIDKYFEENYNAQGNYDKEIKLSLSHFMSGEIREHLCNREGVFWERCDD